MLRAVTTGLPPRERNPRRTRFDVPPYSSPVASRDVLCAECAFVTTRPSPLERVGLSHQAIGSRTLRVSWWPARQGPAWQPLWRRRLAGELRTVQPGP